MNDDLINKYRPQSLEEVYGQDAVVKSLKSLCEANIPHAFLLSGNSGVGKTTIARIISKELDCGVNNLIEIDAATHTGVDSMRELCKGLRYPAHGENNIKFVIIDECFVKDTKILLLDEEKVIQDIKIGDDIYHKNGIGKVTRLFKNKINLQNIVKIIIGDIEIICSKGHLFWVENEGWVKAVDLTIKHLILSKRCNIMKDNTNLIGGLDAKIKKWSFKKSLWKMQERIFNNSILSKNMWGVQDSTLRIMPKGFSAKTQETKILFKSLLNSKQSQTIQNKTKEEDLYRLWKFIYYFGTSNFGLQGLFYCCKRLSCLPKEIYSFKKFRQIIMLKNLWKQNCWEVKNWANTFFRVEKEYKKRFTNILCRGKSREAGGEEKSIFFKNEREQSHVCENNSRENVKYKADKWNFAYLERKAWGQWTLYSITNAFSYCFGMGYGSSYSYASETAGGNLSNLLQSGYWKQEIEDRNRGGRQSSSNEKSCIKRQKENRQVESVRVESVEIYERGSNDGSFKDTIGDKERDQGFVEFYDLEVEGHPSYYANGVLVHNCHRLSGSSWDSLLKIIEEPPSHLYFVFCTTELSKVPKTIQTRCVHYNLKDVRTDDLLDLLESVCKEEDIGLDNNSLLLIAKEAYGSPRRMLSYLSKCCGCKSLKEVKEILEQPLEDNKVIDLCRLLVSRRITWEKVKPIINDLKDIDQAGVHIQICHYMNSCILRARTDKEVFYYLTILDTFSKPVYQSTGVTDLLLNVGSIVFNKE